MISAWLITSAHFFSKRMKETLKNINDLKIQYNHDEVMSNQLYQEP